MDKKDIPKPIHMEEIEIKLTGKNFDMIGNITHHISKLLKDNDWIVKETLKDSIIIECADTDPYSEEGR